MAGAACCSHARSSADFAAGATLAMIYCGRRSTFARSGDRWDSFEGPKAWDKLGNRSGIMHLSAITFLSQHLAWFLSVLVDGSLMLL